MSDGYLDTNVVVHAFTRDAYSEECRDFLKHLEFGQIHVRLETIVIHELLYVLPRYLKQLSRSDIAELVLSIMSSPGVTVSEEPLVTDALNRWASSTTISFVDSLLISAASVEGAAVFSKNVMELRAHGATAPDPLSDAYPSGAPS